ncbi:Ammonium transporter [Rhodovulum sp. P5]|uniref:ammonium transporter n=1 Tax=Rhodovulum sp. P5 TaxID=1564506 RepID=UPI0009C3AF80|nr:ammonium transporter [Rhodovulum sp. P5]ARE41983.1 Ammonium transporter [Rhodovulum sp. P5]
MSMIDAFWVVLCALIVLDMQAGFLCLEAGTVREKNAANVALKNLSDVCFVSLLFWAVGFGLMYGPSVGGLFGTGPFFPDMRFPEQMENAGFLLFQMAFAATAATIVSGAVAERERYEGYILLSIILGGFVYPVVGHWIWGANLGGSGGWLQALGFHDFAGATVVHSLGGWAALCAVIVLGPRLGRFGGKNRHFEENSIALAALGTILLWIGWGAFNGGSALAFSVSVPRIVIHTMLTAASGGIAAVVVSRMMYGFVRIDLVLNGVLAGLVAGTAGVDYYGPFQAIAVGMAGAIAMIATDALLQVGRIDDVVGAVPVHLGAGIAGTLLVALLAPVDVLPAGGRLAQLGVQALGVAAVGAFVIATVLPAALLLNALNLLRATRRGEVEGLNLTENRRHNAFLDLLQEMKKHSRSADFTKRARVERSTEAGALASRYNQVLDRVEDEIARRMSAMRKEREMRLVVEESFEAMRKAQEEAAWAARHDSLTGLGNRMLLDEIMKAPAGNAEDDASLLLVALDLDRFKDVNDTHGHEAGDMVLTACARRLRERTRGGKGFAFRVGGDEFAMLLDFGGDEGAAQFFCDMLLDELLEPTRYASGELRVGASIGFARLEPGEALAAAYKRADLALCEAKRNGRNQAIAYSATIGAAHDQHLALINDFKGAIDRGEIAIQLQPQVDARTRALSGIEVLARWRHPHRGTLSPDVFIPIAEELNLLADVDRRVLDLALEARLRIAEALGAAPEIAVNVSAFRLASLDLIEELRTRPDLPSEGLAFEILETAFLDSLSDEFETRIDALRAMGIRIEVDDFGTGHASFASVLAVKPDRLKIDRMFVADVDKDPGRRDLMRGLVDMARNVRAETVVEGVETMSEAQAIAEVGADHLQGFAFARPLDLSDFIEWAVEQRGRAEALANAG